MTNSVRFTFSVGDTSSRFTISNRKKNRIGDTNYLNKTRPMHIL